MRPDFQQHPHHLFVRAAVQRPIQRRYRRRRRRIWIHMRAAHAAHRVRRTILLVIRVQNEKYVQRRSSVGFGRYFDSVVRNNMFRKFPRKLRSLSGYTNGIPSVCR